MIEELVAKVFNDRNYAHQAHWATDSYAEHMALGSFYDDIIESVDSIVEVYQGKFGKIKLKFEPYSVQRDIVNRLGETADFIGKNRDAMANGCGPVANLLDGLEEIYRQTLYKIVNLS